MTFEELPPYDIARLVGECREQCLWFSRRDRTGYQKAARARRWLVGLT